MANPQKTIAVRFMTLAGPFTTLRTESFATLTGAGAAVVAHAQSGGFSNVARVEEDDPGSYRFTARTPGGRGGRNVAFADVLDGAK